MRYHFFPFKAASRSLVALCISPKVFSDYSISKWKRLRAEIGERPLFTPLIMTRATIHGDPLRLDRGSYKQAFLASIEAISVTASVLHSNIDYLREVPQSKYVLLRLYFQSQLMYSRRTFLSIWTSIFIQLRLEFAYKYLVQGTYTDPA